MKKIFFQNILLIFLLLFSIGHTLVLADQTDTSSTDDADTNSEIDTLDFNAHVYLGLGRDFGTITADEPAFDGIEDRGMHGVFGVIFYNHVSLEMNLGGFDLTTTEPAQAINYPPDDGNYGFFAFNVKINLLDVNKWKISPWFALSSSTQDIGLRNYQYSLAGACNSIMPGVDILITRSITLRASKNHCVVDATEALFGDINSKFETNIYAVDLVYTFGL